MKKIIFEIRYYLLFLILFLGLFFTLIFSTDNSKKTNDIDFKNGEVIRANIPVDKILSLDIGKNQSSNRTQIIYVEKNNTLIQLLDESGLENKYIRALIKAKGS